MLRIIVLRPHATRRCRCIAKRRVARPAARSHSRFVGRGFAANGTPRGPWSRLCATARPKTTNSAALFWQRYGTKCKKGIAMRSALILRDFGQISAWKRACPCHQGLTVIRETQTGYSLSCLRVPDLGPPYRSAPGRERFPCIARAQYDSAAPRFSSSLENDA